MDDDRSERWGLLDEQADDTPLRDGITTQLNRERLATFAKQWEALNAAGGKVADLVWVGDKARIVPCVPPCPDVEETVVEGFTHRPGPECRF